MADKVDETKLYNVNEEINNTCKKSIVELTDYYELNKCIECIRNNKFSKVALQFPDYQLCDASKLASKIERETQCKTYILADTCYGSCCVDEVAAEHAQADCIIHFGPSCLSLTNHVPVLYVFGKEPVDIEKCCLSFKNIFADKNSKVLIIYEVVYQHAMEDIYTRLRTEYEHVVLTCLNCPKPKEKCLERSSKTDVGCDEIAGHKKYLRFGRIFTLPECDYFEDYSVFFIGKESLTLTNHLISYNKCQFFTFNPETNSGCKETTNVNKMLMRRYHLIERAKDSRIVGILVGTLGITNYLSAINRVKEVITLARKKYYTFIIGKLSPEKLANFLEIDIFVLIACPENSLINSKEFHKPIVTPFEIEIACTSAREWTGEYVTDFQQLLPGAANHVEITGNHVEHNIPDVSLISGQLRHIPLNQEEMGTDCLTLRNQDKTVATYGPSNAVGYFENRSWKGLEVKRSETLVSKFVEGKSGIPPEYVNKISSNNKHCEL